MERAGVAAPTVPSFLRLRRAWETGVVSETVFGRLLGGFVLLVVVASALRLGHGPAAQTFLLVFTSIVIEALPFILVGALASAAIAVFLPERALDSLARLPLALQIPGAALSGVAFPVCECGSVPVARRLIARGVHPGAGIAFMLSSPVLNPIVLASTWVAYGGHARGAEMVAGRASLGLVAACAAGLAIGRRTRASDLLRARPGERAEAHDHEQGDRATAFSTHLVSDFLFMGKFIVLGAGLSALVQASVPESALSTLGGAPVMSSLALMLVAFVLSLCSEADAFIAASFTSFSSGAQLAFLVFGPIADLKLSVLYGATFRRWFLLRLLAVTVPLIVIGTLIFEAVT
ncbi:MAG: permease [Actinobacteria bacterium]|nr:MAG: permease [Actinomycetota bacterium]